MKLRLRGNSLRLRLDRTEIDQIGKGEIVVETCRFGPDPSARLSCFVEAVAQDAPLRANFHHGAISVYHSTAEAKRLIETNEVTVSASQDIGDGQILQITLEKDFVCLTPREGEDDTHAYPNPKLSHDCE
jgi:hypothetical protein